MRLFIQLVLLAAALSGCVTTSSFKGVCVLHPIGKTEQDLVAYATYCEASE